MSPVRTWQYVQAVKVSMGKVDESHAILADEASTAPIRELPVPSAHVMPVLTTTFNGPTVDVSVGQATQASTSRQPVQQTAEQFAEPMSAAGVSTQVPPNMRKYTTRRSRCQHPGTGGCPHITILNQAYPIRIRPAAGYQGTNC